MPHLFSEPSFRFSRGPKRSPSQHFARVRRTGVVEGLSCYLPMRFVSIGKPHVHHERISVVGAFNPIGARLWFQSHRDKSHFPNCPMLAKNLRREGTSALRSGQRRRIAPWTQSRRSDFVPRGTQSLPPPGFLESRRPRVFPQRNPLSGSRPGHAFLAASAGMSSMHMIVRRPCVLCASGEHQGRRSKRPPQMPGPKWPLLWWTGGNTAACAL